MFPISGIFFIFFAIRRRDLEIVSAPRVNHLYNVIVGLVLDTARRRPLEVDRVVVRVLRLVGFVAFWLSLFHGWLGYLVQIRTKRLVVNVFKFKTVFGCHWFLVLAPDHVLEDTVKDILVFCLALIVL